MRGSANLSSRADSPSPSNAGAAPHPPAGTFSPYSDGEKAQATNLSSCSTPAPAPAFRCRAAGTAP
ncbi:MAG: hypothetical protein E5W93_17165 [Mesorhizobium sp.]|nr:MAG: hypothetical protein E5W93_17165 [Mesorhizobium sp.]